ncbi:sialate O-acetylesterase [Saccharicrinis fermentans]|uniref:Sialate O-acetylesterase domain-containing protein n=1 Tax=Saccharicrinis fermentans DSM 9555 = JCM 21142 TaxID=869213 RepID=W7XXU7_9BACT|nr:sialate O-acetylesterase [Saccharicrinis fermentans]GAF03335.1 hypothetical protein JCM21142_42003 [Saccharicrinis fermentans DSM 9555 = JCM 21142]
MKIYKLIISFSIIVLSLTSCKSLSKTSTQKKAAHLDIYLLIGQSNMAGRAPFKEHDKDTLKNVFLYTGNDSILWEKAANPLNKYSTIRKNISMQKMGPGYTFAQTMASQSKNPIGLVVNAKGGSNIQSWAPGTTFYNEAVRRTKEALKQGQLKGIIWHQGEANASKYKQYIPQIIALIQALRKDFNQPNLPFVAGQLSEDKINRKNFNQMILTLPGKIKNVGIATSENMTTIDQTHFNSASQRILGKRYAAEMLRLLSIQ